VCLADRSAEVRKLLIAAGAVPAGTQTYEILRVEAGTPRIGIDMDENRFVVEVGRAHAICHTKGCYLGQEPIVMARDRGQVNRHLAGLRIAGADPVPPGTRLLHADADAGQVTSSTFSPRLGEVIALAYLRRGHQEAGTVLTMPDVAGRTAIVSSLPIG